jgi:hypothetical protein
MVQPTRLRFLLIRMDERSRRDFVSNPIASTLSPVEASIRRREVGLCLLLESRERLRNNTLTLARARRCLAVLDASRSPSFV